MEYMTSLSPCPPGQPWRLEMELSAHVLHGLLTVGLSPFSRAPRDFGPERLGVEFNLTSFGNVLGEVQLGRL